MIEKSSDIRGVKNNVGSDGPSVLAIFMMNFELEIMLLLSCNKIIDFVQHPVYGVWLALQCGQCLRRT